MLRGDVIELRPVRDADLATLYELMTNLDTRGPYFPLGVMSEPAFRSAFAKNGFWDTDEGMLVMVKDGEIVGEIEYFPISHYLQGYEISYQLFGEQHAGRGYTSEAVRLLVGYVFGRKRVNRCSEHPPAMLPQARRPEVCSPSRGRCAAAGSTRASTTLEVWSILRDEATALTARAGGRCPLTEGDDVPGVRRGGGRSRLVEEGSPGSAATRSTSPAAFSHGLLKDAAGGVWPRTPLQVLQPPEQAIGPERHHVEPLLGRICGRRSGSARSGIHHSAGAMSARAGSRGSGRSTRRP